MRKLAAVLLLAVAAQCQTTNAPQAASNAADPSHLTMNYGVAANDFLMAQLSDSITAAPMSQAVGGSVTAAGQPILKTAVLKPMKVNTVNQDRARNARVWYSLVVFNHVAAGFDAYSTRQAIGHGGVELNPFLKPFASSAAIYPALQVWPTGMDFVGNRMMHSQNRFMRRAWWVPQVASTAAFVSFGIHNLGVHAQ
jgi:hypothetical protein